MTVQRLKTYRLTCDGEIMWKGYREECDAVTTVQHTSRDELMTDLRRNMVGELPPPFTGWHTNEFGYVLCPREDHIE